MDGGTAPEDRDAAANPAFILTTFGAPSLSRDGRDVRMTNRKAVALLAYLANTTQGTESRQRLAGLLWSESSEEKARASLRQTVADLRAAFEPTQDQVFSADRTAIRLIPGAIVADVARLKAQLRAGSVDPLFLEHKRLCESYLAGFEDLDSAFGTWLTVQRQCLHDEFVRLLEDLARSQPDLFLLKRAGLALVNLDPTHEIGCRTAMEASARLGDSAGALRLYRDLWDVLGDEFGHEPSEETQALVTDIKLGRIGPARGVDPRAASLVSVPRQDPARPGAGDVLYLFVGRFDGDAGASPGGPTIRVFRHELIAALVRFRDWAVVELEDDQVSPPRPGYLVEATSSDTEDGLRLTLTLKNLSTRRFLWSEQFALAPSGWYRTQQRIIRRIAVALDVSMSSERLAQISGIPELSLDQFDKWLKGQELIFRWRPEDEARAEALFRSIVREAPTFAPAYAGIAGIINSRHLIFPGRQRSADQHAEALGFARTAVQLSPIDSRAHLHLAWSFAMNGVPERAASAYLMACELNPNDPWTLVSSTLGLAYAGDLDNAARLARATNEAGLGMSRLNHAYQAGVRFILGDLEGCVAAAEQAGDAVFYIGAWKAAALALLGEAEAATRAGEHFLDVIRGHWFGDEPATDEAILRWLMHAFPLADARVKADLSRGLVLAGLPAGEDPPALRGGNDDQRQPRIV